MTSPIDPIRRAAHLRRARKSDVDRPEEAAAAEVANLPVPVGPATTVPPRGAATEGGSTFAAQLMGQDGQKRGLRAGAPLFDAAKATYNQTEWSGARDRRARKGRVTKTEV